MSAVDPGVYRAVLRVRAAYPFDIAGLLMRFYAYMMSIGTVTMLSLSGYSFLTSGVVASVIALAIFLLSPRVSKLVDERGQSKVIPLAAGVVLIGLVMMLGNVVLQGPDWLFFPAALLMGCIPNAQAIVRARWTYLIRTGRIRGEVPSIRTVFSYEGILDDIGFMLSPPISIALASSIAPVAGLVIGGVVFILGVILMTLAKSTEPAVGWSASEEEAPSKEAPGEDGAEAGAATRQKSIIRTSTVVRILFVLMFLTGAMYGVFDTSSVAFAEMLDNPNIAGMGLVIGGVISALMGFFFGMIRLNLALYKQLTVCAVLLGVAYGSQILIEAEMTFYLVSAFAALTYAPFLIVINSAVERAVPGRRLTEAITWVNSGMTCGVALGPTVAGIIVDFFGPPVGFDAGGIVALLIPLITLFSFRIIRRTVRDDAYEVALTSQKTDTP